MERFDKYWIGIVAGLLIPALFCLIYIDSFHLWYALQTFQFQAGSLLYKLLMVSVFPNLALLYVFYLTNTWKLAKGILIGAFPYIIAAVILGI